jgi:hypothetical protein
MGSKDGRPPDGARRIPDGQVTLSAGSGNDAGNQNVRRQEPSGADERFMARLPGEATLPGGLPSGR